MARSLQQQPHSATGKATITPSSQVPKSVTLTETYSVATIVRHKLGQEAGRSEYQLRRLVAHANTLDLLMEELSDLERGFKSRFNALMHPTQESHRSQNGNWMDTILEEIEEIEEIEEDDDSDSDSDFHDLDDDRDAEERETFRGTKAKSPLPKQWIEYFATKDQLSGGNEEAQAIGYSIERNVPELIHDLGSDSEGESSNDDCRQPLSEQYVIATTNRAQCGSPTDLKAEMRETVVALC